MLPFEDAAAAPPIRANRPGPATSIRQALETSRLAGFAGTASSGNSSGNANANAMAGLVGRPLWEIERDAIEATIAAAGGSIPRAARILGVSPSTIYRKREAWEKRRS
jgi:DNA-binding NtrC family response regulator